MPTPIFNRYERKYIITTQQKEELYSFFKEYLIEDPYSIGGKEYTIYNLYFDTHDFSIIRNSVQKPIFKDKLRLRSYQSPLSDNDLVFLEIKKKYEGRINKRRVILTYKDAILYLSQGIMPHFNQYIDQQIMSEIDYFIRIHRANPGAFIKYNRIALMSPNDQLRVTFDHQIVFRNDRLDLNIAEGQQVLSDHDYWLMEVKCDNNFPFWLARKLSDYHIYSQSFSKYGKAYQKYLLVGGTSNESFIHLNQS